MSLPPQKILGSALAALERAEQALDETSQTAARRVTVKQAELALYVRTEATEVYGSVRAFSAELARRMELAPSTVRNVLKGEVLRSDVLAEAVALLAEAAQAAPTQKFGVAA